jgi:hypothetical protein
MAPPPPPDDDDDHGGAPAVDPADAAALQRWFSLPSGSSNPAAMFAPPDPEVIAAQEKRRAAVLAAIDPALCDRVANRFVAHAERFTFTARIDVRLDPDITMVDQTQFGRQAWLAEVREVEIPDQLREDLRECVP